MSFRHSLYIGDDGALCANVKGKSYISMFEKLTESKDLSRFTYAIVAGYLFNDVAEVNLESTFDAWMDKRDAVSKTLANKYSDTFAQSFIFQTNVLLKSLINQPESEIKTPTDYYQKWFEPLVFETGHEKYDLNHLHDEILSFFNDSVICLSVPNDEFEFCEKVLKPLCAATLYTKVSVL